MTWRTAGGIIRHGGLSTVVGFRSVVMLPVEVRDQRSDIREQRSENRDQRTENSRQSQSHFKALNDQIFL